MNLILRQGIELVMTCYDNAAKQPSCTGRASLTFNAKSLFKMRQSVI